MNFQKIITKAIYLSTIIFSILPVGITSSHCYGQQISIHRVDVMPNMPNHYVMRDWKQVAKDYDAFTFNFNTTGQYLPLIWWDYSSTNYPRVVFGQPSYVGFPGMTTGAGNNHESVNCLGAVVGASLVGIDKSNQNGYNFALMEQNYYNKANGQDLVLDRSNMLAENTDFFNDLMPHILFYQLVSFYPAVDLDITGSSTTSIMQTTADRWYQASYAMGGNSGIPNFNQTTFNFSVNSAINNGSYTEPDSAAAIAWLEYMAYTRLSTSSDTAIFLQSADWGMKYLETCTFNPNYDVFMPYGAYIAARMNAELGRSYSVDTLLNWSFESSAVRGSDWSVSTGNWGGYDANGLPAGMTDGGGYAFALESFHYAGTLVPLVRYDEQYARGIGKWMLNLANSAQYFYANALDSAHQSCAWWQYPYDPGNCLSYEGFRNFGRVCDRVISDYSNVSGIVVSGTYGATSIYSTDGLYEVLQESTVGNYAALNHIWQLNLTPGYNHWILVNAYYLNAGDSDNGFTFSWSTSPAGPFTYLYTVTYNAYPGTLLWNIIPDNVSGTVYIQAQSANPTPGNQKLNTLYVDAIWVVSDLTTTPYTLGDGYSGYPIGIQTDIALYGGAHVGILGSIVSTTNVNYILQLDCLKTDYYHDTAYPTYLYYNPYTFATSVQIDVGPDTKDLYEVTNHTFLETSVSGLTSFSIPADSAVLLVVAPAGGVQSQKGKKLLINGVIVDYNAFPLDINDWKSY